jgi:DNA-binding response OmpR family regulator
MTPSPAAQSESEDSTRPEVLLVEDNADMRATLRKHLATTYEVLEAARGDVGLKLVQTEMPDVVVSDIMMPGMDGYALCRAVKSDPETDYIPVILLTAKIDAASKIEGLEGGADDYICKPFDPAELLLRIRNLLTARARLRARYRAQLEPPAMEATSVPVPSSNAGFKSWVRAVLDRESQEVSFDVPALADKLHISRSHLHRCIKEDFGLSPSELILRFRLERAARMLIRGEGNVGEIAYAVGFKNLSHFAKRFREQYGQTPAAYAAAPRQSPEAPGTR